MILVERRARLAAELAVARAHTDRIVLDLELERLRFQLAKARREAFGQSSEAGTRIGQFELALEDVEETLAAMRANDEMATPATSIDAFTRRKPARRPLPEHLSRVRQVYPSPSACPCCAGRLHKLGEDITESLERVPASWFVIQHVREKFSCRSCEAITQPPAPSHPIARGRAGPVLLAEIACGKFCLHLPLHRQSRAFAREGVEIDVSTMADWMGAVSVALKPVQSENGPLGGQHSTRSHSPDEGLWAFVGGGDVAGNCLFKVVDRAEDTALQALPCELGEEALHGVEPRARGRREVERPSRVGREPGQHLGVLVGGACQRLRAAQLYGVAGGGGVVVEDGVDDLAWRHGSLDGRDEADELLVAMAGHAAGPRT